MNLKYMSLFIRTFSKKRPEQGLLRNYLINNRDLNCIICEKHLPSCLLEAAHLKPRHLLKKYELRDVNNVEFMCRYCHNLYDNALLSIRESNLCVSPNITFYKKYDLHYENNKIIHAYTIKNSKYFDFHYNFIYKKTN